jgi:hypothetical protein
MQPNGWSAAMIIWTGLAVGTVGAQPASPVPSANAHPGYDNYEILPKGWEGTEQKSIGGIALLPDGRMVTTIWRDGSPTNRNGEAYLLSGVLTAKTGADVSVAPLGTKLFDPLGVTVVNGIIYVLEKDRLSKYTANGSNWTYALEYDGHNPFTSRYFYHWFSMGLVYTQGKFNWTLGGFTQYSEFVDEEPLKHGTWVQYDPATRTHKFLVHGLRNTGGIALGPEGTLCTTDNQGEWEPSNKFICMEPGSWYGWDGPNALARQGLPESPPTVWNTYDDLGNSPGQSVLLPKGRYAGQMIMTDVNKAWLTRLCLEKVKGSWQGANLFFTGGFNSGTFRLLLGPDSSTIIVAGMGGNGGGWKYGTTYTSLHRLVPNQTEVFEILAVRSKSATSMELEFTLPANAAAGVPANYTVTSWKNIPSSGYGAGHKQMMKTLPVSAVALTPDGRKAALTIPGLEEGRIVRISLNAPIASSAGKALWFRYADYTLNHFGPGDAVSVARGIDGASPSPILHALLGIPGGLSLRLPDPGAYALEITTPQGRTVVRADLAGPCEYALTRDRIGPGIYVLKIRNAAGGLVSEKVSLL